MINKARVFMAGDTVIHSSVYTDALCPDGSYDFKPMLQYLKPFASAFDLSYYVQETMLAGKEYGLSSYPRFQLPSGNRRRVYRCRI